MSTATLAREPAIGLERAGRAVLFIGSLLLFWITLEPLMDLSSGSLLEPTESSDLFNQVLFLSMFGVLVAMLVAMGYRRIAPLVHPAYLALVGWFLLDCGFALNPGLSFRRLVLTIIVMVIVGVLLLLPRNQREFESWVGGVALTVVALSYLAVIFVPHLAIHQSDAAMETNLAGSWRGIYAHKSLTGPMMIAFVFVGAFLTSRRHLVLGPLLIGLAGLFLLFTGAKQPQALVVMVFVFSWLASRVKSTGWLLALCLGPFVLYQTFTVGSAVFPWVAEFNKGIMTDPTFTNRNGIWDFAIKNFLDRPIFGFGFFGFWNTEYVRYTVVAPPDTYAATASHSHNTYLDIALTTGFPGLVLTLAALVVLPLIDFARARRVPENRDLALLFFRIWLFAVFLGSLETVFFLRDNAFWVTFLLAVFGLRYLASYRVQA